MTFAALAGAAISFAGSADAGSPVIATPYGCNSQVVVKAGYNGECARAVQWTVNAWIARTSQRITPLKVTGSFDAPTVAALKAFQKGHKITVSGVVDARTWPALIQEAAAATPPKPGLLKTPFGCNTRPTLNLGTTGECVKATAYALNSWSMKATAGFALLPTDGVFTPALQQELQAFQGAQGLKPSGSVDAATWRKLETVSSATADRAGLAIPGAAGLDHQAFPGAVKLRDGRLMAIVRGGTQHVPDSAHPTSLWSAYSPDNGYTWTTPQKLTVTVPGAAPDAVVAYTDPALSVPQSGSLAGRPVLTFFTYTFTSPGTSPTRDVVPAQSWICVADDASGTSWGTPHALAFDPGARNYVSSAARQLDGDRFISAGYVWAVALGAATTNVLSPVSLGLMWNGHQFVDGALTAMAHPDAQHEMSEPNIIRLHDGRLMGLIRVDPNRADPAAGTQSYIETTYSNDRGATWTNPVVSFEGSGNPHVTQLTNGTLVVAYRHLDATQLQPGASRDGKLYAVYRTSRDGGLSWSDEQHIGPHDSQYEMTYAVPVETAPNKVTFVWGDESAGGGVSQIQIGTADFS